MVESPASRPELVLTTDWKMPNPLKTAMSPKWSPRNAVPMIPPFPLTMMFPTSRVGLVIGLLLPRGLWVVEISVLWSSSARLPMLALMIEPCLRLMPVRPTAEMMLPRISQGALLVTTPIWQVAYKPDWVTAPEPL